MYSEILKLIWEILWSDTAQSYLLMKIIRTILKTNEYKIEELSDKHVTYFICIYFIVNQLFKFKVTEFLMNHTV